jgi:hypothetical protein
MNQNYIERPGNSWADVNLNDASVHSPGLRFAAPVPFGEKYPVVPNPLELHSPGREDMLRRVDVFNLSEPELELALSRTPATTPPPAIAAAIKERVLAFRVGKPVNQCEGLARRMLIESSSELARLDAKRAEAKRIENEADQIESSLRATFAAWTELPRRAESLQARLSRPRRGGRRSISRTKAPKATYFRD